MFTSTAALRPKRRLIIPFIADTVWLRLLQRAPAEEEKKMLGCPAKSLIGSQLSQQRSPTLSGHTAASPVKEKKMPAAIMKSSELWVFLQSGTKLQPIVGEIQT